MEQRRKANRDAKRKSRQRAKKAKLALEEEGRTLEAELASLKGVLQHLRETLCAHGMDDAHIDATVRAALGELI